jgi:hypothetical protein
MERINKINKIVQGEKSMEDIRRQILTIPLVEIMKESPGFIEFKADLIIFRIYGVDSEENVMAWGKYSRRNGIRGWFNYYMYRECILTETSFSLPGLESLTYL